MKPELSKLKKRVHDLEKIKQEQSRELNRLNQMLTNKDRTIRSLNDKVQKLENELVSKDRLTKKLATFFDERNLAIVDYASGGRSEDYYEVAKHIWNAKEVLIPFIKNFSRTASICEKQFEYDATSLSKDESDQLWNFCEYMHDVKEWFSFKRENSIYYVELPENNHVLNFFTGFWGEEVSLYLIVKALNNFTENKPEKYKLFWNVTLRHFGSNKSTDIELDLVVQIKGHFYIFEVKTGELLQRDKWRRLTDLFDGEQSKYITCTSDENLDPMTFRPFTLFSLPTLEEQFLQLLNIDFGDKSE